MSSSGDGPPVPSDPETRRALELDTLAAVLPMDRRDRLAELLTDEDVATLTHLAREGMGENTLRALASDLGYLEAWCRAATDEALPWPAPVGLALKFVAHHLWDPAEREADPNHGMPQAVVDELRGLELLRVEGPHAVATVRRRLAHWSTLHRFRGLDGPFKDPCLRTALSLAARASRRPRGRKSERAVTADIIEKLLETCPFDHQLSDLRDSALLLIAFASGGRRRSEVARLRVEDVVREAPIPLDLNDPVSPLVPKRAVLSTWAALRIHDRGRAARGAPARGHAAVAAPLRAAGGTLLQRSRARAGVGRAAHLRAARDACLQPPYLTQKVRFGHAFKHTFRRKHVLAFALGAAPGLGAAT